MVPGGGGGGGGSGGAANLSATNSMYTPMHSGGIVGRDGSPIRLHNGLASDEYPVILQRGEAVIPKGGGVQPPSVVINNNTGQAMKMQEEGPVFNGSDWVVTIIVDELTQGGLLRDTIRGLK